MIISAGRLAVRWRGVVGAGSRILVSSAASKNATSERYDAMAYGAATASLAR
ncbi:hypothetical protein [Streptomyces sp. NPDC048606]|uniref:hypothetical protein n=1 Tax=Streptomyces sp. NPDC048606 TaxID=3154726 RepID=UPI003422E383